MIQRAIASEALGEENQDTIKRITQKLEKKGINHILKKKQYVSKIVDDILKLVGSSKKVEIQLLSLSKELQCIIPQYE